VDFDENTTIFGQRVGYGIMDRLTAAITYQNQLKGRTSIEGNGNSDEEGPLNPDITVLYRILKQEDDSITLDAYVSYAPDMFDSETNSTKNESDAASGGTAFTIGGRGAKKFTNLEMMAEISLTANGDREAKDTVSKRKAKADSNAQSSISYSVQFPLEKGFWVRGTLTAQTESELKVKFSDGTSAKRATFGTSEIAGSLLYEPIDQHLVVQIGLGLGGQGEYKTKFSDGTSQKYRDVGTGRLFLSALYQF